MYTIQRFEPTDENYKTYVAIHNVIYPEMPLKVETRRYEDEQHNTAYHQARDFILKDETIIGYGGFGEAFWFGDDGGYFWMNICIHPDQQRQGAAAFWYANAESRICDLGGKHIMVETIETEIGAIEMLRRRGFTQVMRNARSRVDLTELDFDAMPNRAAQLAAEGIEIRTLRDLKGSYSDWVARALDITNAIGVDVPRSEEYRPIPLRDFKRWMAHPHSDENGWFYAVDTQIDEVIGLSTIHYDPNNPQKVKVGETGVRRNYRRRGIARALKIATMRFAHSVGGRTIDTDNEENNPMYKLNLQLGFKPLPANVEFKKTLQKIK